MKKTLIILALIATTAIAYCQPSLWPYPKITPSATDTLLIWHEDSTKVITWQEVLDASGETFDTTYLYSVLDVMTDTTDALRVDIFVNRDSLVEHISRILANEAAIALNTAKTTNATHSGEVTGSGALTIADDVIEAANLEATNSPTDNYIPSYDLASLGFTWVANAAGGGGDMSYTDTTAMLTPYPDFTEMRGEISDSIQDLLDNGEAAVALADSSGVAAGSYVTGWDFVAGQALKAPLASPTFTTQITIGSGVITATEAGYIDPTSSIQTQLDSKQSPNYTAINTESGTTYTFVIADDDEYTRFTSGSAVTVTFPLNSSVAFPIGATIDCVQAGAGTLTFDVAAGVTANYFNSDSVSAGQGAIFTAIKVATDEWDVTGNF